MLNLLTDRRYRDCDGSTRRDFLKVGMLGMGSLGLPGLLAARAQAAAAGQAVKDTSVVWVWLGGGPTHVETFDPKMTAPSEYRSTTGECTSNVPGMTVGGTFPKLAQVCDKMALVRSFAHNNSGHGGGTHFVMTGYDNRNIDNGGLPSRPSLGSILARVRGANHPVTGMPTYVRQGGIGTDGPAFLGAAYSPFDPGGQAKKDMTLSLTRERLADRRVLLNELDRLNHQVDSSGLMKGLDGFEQQAFNLVLSKAPEAFDLNKEDPRVVEQYGKSRLAEQMLRARRLCEAGCGFVTVSYGGWDMHGNIKQSMERRGPELDHALATFIEDVAQRGLDDRILLVVTGEFGRTPRITLAMAGGGLRMGQCVGESAPKVDVPHSEAIRPQDLMATIFHVLGIDPRLQFTNQAGRPVYMIEEGRAIQELI